MSVTFYNFNLAQYANITASNENALFPVSNLQDYRRTKVFRSTSSSVNIVFDMLTAEPVDSFCIVDHPTNGFGFDTMTLEGNATANFSSPAFTQAITSADQEHGVGVTEFASQSYRFWRLVVTGATYVELSNIFIGAKNALTTTSVAYGWKFQDEDLAKVSTNRIGQVFADQIGRQRKMSLPFRTFNKSEMDQFFEIYDLNGITKPFFMKISTGSNSILTNENRFAGMFRMPNIPQLTNKSYAFYDFSASLVEAM